MHTPFFQFSAPSMFIVRTKFEPDDEEWEELVIRAFSCTAVEVALSSGVLTVVTADHVQIAVAGYFHEIEALAKDQLALPD